MGGGGGGGGAAVPTISPVLADKIGLIQANAAQAAANQATTMMNEAIAAMNKQFMVARNDVQPYRTQGVQALNKLNQYIGLDAYNPGLAPTAPKAPSAADIKDYEVADYIKMNTTPIMSTGGKINRLTLNDGDHVDSWDSNGMKDWLGNGAQAKYTQGLVRKDLADRYMDQQQPIYDANVEAYNQNKFEYDQNLAMYNKYQAEGPKTSQQIADEISNQPGYQAELSQGIDALQKSGSARGYLGSGRLLKEISSYGQNTLSKYYGNTLSLLAQQAGQGQAAATSTAQGSMAQGQGLASLYSGLGDTLANASLAAGQARANAIQLGGTQYKMIGGSDGGGLGGIGSLLGGIGSLASAFPTAPCSIALKDSLGKPSTKEILEKVDSLTLDKWKYKDIDTAHIGPYAEEFRELFGVGTGQTINMIDVCGVLLGAVKELSKKVKQLESK